MDAIVGSAAAARNPWSGPGQELDPHAVDDPLQLLEIGRRVARLGHHVDHEQPAGCCGVGCTDVDDPGPEGSTGWHTHPGPAVAVVHSGSLTILSAHDGACESVTYTAGESFVDQGQGHVHLGRNPSSSAGTTVFVTYFAVPAGAAGPRIDAPDPGGC
jgi:hypothetical protein